MDFQEYFAWAHSKGIRSPKMQYPVLYSHGCYGSRAIEDISPGETIMTCPNEAIFSFAKAYNSELKHIFDAEFVQHSGKIANFEYFVMAAFLVYEKYKKEASDWSIFIQYQPRSLVLTDWTNSERTELQDTDIEYELKRRLMFDQMSYLVWKKALEKHKNYFRAEMLEIQEFQWASRLLSTRAFGKFVPNYSLVPIADCLNHSNSSTYYCYSCPEETVDASIRYASFDYFDDCDDENLSANADLIFEKIVTILSFTYNLGQEETERLKTEAIEIETSRINNTKKVNDAKSCKLEDDPQMVFRVIADERGYRAGDQIFLNYGRYSNRHLLCHYGFAMENNTFDYAKVKLKFEEVSAECANVSRNLGYTNYCEFKLKMQRINLDLLRTIRALKWNPSFGIDCVFNPKSLELEIDVLLVYRNILGKILDEFPTSLEDDLNLAQRETDSKKYYAILYRTGVKKIILEHIQMTQIADRAIKDKMNRNTENKIDESCCEALLLYLRNIADS